MNRPFNTSPPSTARCLPSDFDALCPTPQLLPGESLERYQVLQAAIFQDLAPQSAIEWLIAVDIAELSWEIQRYRRLRHKLLETYRQKAVEATLRRIDVASTDPDLRDRAELYTVQNALDWQIDPIASREIEARLASYGFDQHTISVEVYVQAREIFELFESLLNTGQLRRLYLLKEINSHRRLLALPTKTVSASGPSRPNGSKVPCLRNPASEVTPP